MMVVTVEDGEADTDQRRLGIALQKLSVRVANQKVDRLGEEQRTHMPQILARIDMAAFPNGELASSASAFSSQAWPPLVERMCGFGSKFQQETRQAKAEIGIAKECEFLAVDVRARIGDGVDKSAALLPDRIRDRLAGEARDLHQELIGAVHTNGMIEGDGLLAQPSI